MSRKRERYRKKWEGILETLNKKEELSEIQKLFLKRRCEEILDSGCFGILDPKNIFNRINSKSCSQWLSYWKAKIPKQAISKNILKAVTGSEEAPNLKNSFSLCKAIISYNLKEEDKQGEELRKWKKALGLHKRNFDKLYARGRDYCLTFKINSSRKTIKKAEEEIRELKDCIGLPIEKVPHWEEYTHLTPKQAVIIRDYFESIYEDYEDPNSPYYHSKEIFEDLPSFDSWLDQQIYILEKSYISNERKTLERLTKPIKAGRPPNKKRFPKRETKEDKPTF
ncbi:hypothetical protein FAI40_03005 [Acetobacteraceae bacterium]|nr:hypothetical protein FAI40_03005 [Acetobacteraceae bacterium]